MKKRLHFLLGLLLAITVGVNAQNLLDTKFQNCDGTMDEVWVEIHKNQTDPATAFASYENGPGTNTTQCLKLVQTSTAQAKVKSSATLGKFSLESGKIYTIKMDMYVVSSATTALAHKMFVNNSNVGFDNSSVTFANYASDEWFTAECEYTAPSDLTGTNFIIQVNPGTAEIYYDNFSIEERAYEPSVVFNITRPVESSQNVWVTLEGNSQLLSIKTDPIETSTTFTSIAAGTYTYYAMGKGYDFKTGTIDVPADADATVDLAFSFDTDNDAQLIFYSNYSATGPEGKDNTAKSNERAASVFTLQKADDIAYANSGTGYWIGNLNTVGTTAGEIYTYRMEYNNGLHSSHVEEVPVEGSLKPREGYINVDEGLSANSGAMYKYFGWFDAHFVVVDEAGDPVNATISIDGSDFDTGADGISYAELEDDGSTYDYTITATGYVSATGSVSQSDLEVSRDVITAVTLVVDESTDFENAFVEGCKIYPNPATDLVNVEVEGNCTISIITLTGTKVKVVSNASGVSPIAVSDLAKGMYIIEIENGKEKVFEKIKVK